MSDATIARPAGEVPAAGKPRAATAGSDAAPRRPARLRLIGELLLERGLITEADLAAALKAQKEIGGLVGHNLVRLGAISEAQLLPVIAEQLGLPILGRNELPALEDVRAAIARTGGLMGWWRARQAVIWFAERDGAERILCAARNPLDPALQECSGRLHTAPALFHLASQQTLERLLDAMAADERGESEDGFGRNASRLREIAEEAPAIDFVNAMFAEAIERRASDVHVEPFEDSFQVRLRVDGVMDVWRVAPRSAFDAVASRLKLLSGMDIAERRLPQDGRQSIRISGREVDLRVSTLPATWGESLVLRLLGKTTSLPTLDQLGLFTDHQRLLIDLVERPTGVLLITGPTGSGKTTTIYRLITHLNNGVRKIITVEDPVEFDLPGVMQIQVKPEIGLTFASGLRSILRQDPDVIMVGEIRDSETAQIAVQAALTGHLVISTLHTNSAMAAGPRLIDLGVEPYLLSDVVRGLAGQRLMRRLCAACARPADDAARLEALYVDTFGASEGEAKWRDAAGCPLCGGSGYAGRIGVYEIAEASRELSTALREGATESELVAAVRGRGFRSMFEDGLLKARMGLTSFDEIRRVVGGETARAAGADG